MVFAMRSWLANSDSDTESGGKRLKLELNVKVKSRPSDKIVRKAMKLLSMSHLGADSICFDEKEGTFTLVGRLDLVEAMFELRKICAMDLVSVAILTAQNDTFPRTVCVERITELRLIEDTGLETKRSLDIAKSKERPGQSKKQQKDQPPPQQTDSSVSQVEAVRRSRTLPPLSCPLASKARPSSSTISNPSHGTSDQLQAAPDQVPELSFHFAPSSSHIFQTKSLAAMPAHSSISGGACLPKDTKHVEEKGLEGHDQLYDSTIHLLHSSIDGITELKRHYKLRAGEQASRLKEADNAAIILRKQVEELEAKLLMANMTERSLMDMICVSEGMHDRTKRELALMREKMDEANRRVEYLEAAVSRYQNRTVEAEIEKEKAEKRGSRAGVEGDSMNTLVRAQPSNVCPSPAAPRSTSAEPVPSPSPCLTDSKLEVCKVSALFPELTYLD